MMRNKYSVIIMMIALFGGQTALAQKAGRVKKQKTKVQTEEVKAVVQEEQPAVPEKSSLKLLPFRKTGWTPSITTRVGR